MKRTGAQIVWEVLTREGVDIVFGHPGGAILPVYDAMPQYPVRHILARHEQKHGLENESKTIPERVKEIRRVALEAIGELGEQPESDQRKELDNMLD